MKYSKIILAVSLLIGATTACTDKWDEHYSVAQQGDGSLWQAISADASLSNFKQVLQAASYEASLSCSQVCTVFSPNNTMLTDHMRDSLIQKYNEEKAQRIKEKDNSVVKEFIQNHISLYNYSVSNAMEDTTIRMMNGKNLAFTKDKFAGFEYLSKNNPTGNGILYTIGHVAGYQPNVYEALAKVTEIDSVKKYITAYDLEKLDSKNSVPGEIIDGKTHYLDSVTNIENKFLETMLAAKILNEDSCYWMVVPNNQVWNKLVDKYTKYYQYDAKVAERDSFQYHFPRHAILFGTTFSKTDNRKIFNTGTAAATDSLMSTLAASYSMRKSLYGSYDKKYYQYNDPYGEGGVLTDCTAQICSNGKLLKTDKWNLPEKNTFRREIVMEAEDNRLTLDSLNINSTYNKSGDTNPGKTVKVTADNPYYNKVSGNSYLEITPSGVTNFSKALFDVRNVLSNIPYDIYVVVAPAEAGDTTATAIQKLPIIFRCALQCHNEKGEAYYVSLKNGNKLENPVLDSKGNPTTNYTKSAVYDTNRQNDPTKVDSIYIGTVTFPTCSYSTSEPQVKLIFQSYVTSSQYEKTANRTLRLDCIVFKPHDED